MDDQQNLPEASNPQSVTPDRTQEKSLSQEIPSEPAQSGPVQPEPPQSSRSIPTSVPQTTIHVPAQPTVVASPPPKPVTPIGPSETASEVQQRIVQSEQVKEVKRVRRTYKLENAVGVLFGSIEGALALRLIFKLFGARAANAFVNILYQFTGIFANPFDGIFGGNPAFGRFELDMASVIAMIIYALVGFAAVQLTKLF